MTSDSVIENALLDMRKDALLLPNKPTDSEYRELLNKYDSIFTGEKHNRVLSLEIAHYMKVEHDKLLKTLPGIAKRLNMKLEGLYQLKANDRSTPHAYYIDLY